MEQQQPSVNYDPVIAAIKAVKLNPGFMPNRPSNDWKTLFDFYNAHSGFSPLHMTCQPCYKKVYEFTMTFFNLKKYNR